MSFKVSDKVVCVDDAPCHDPRWIRTEGGPLLKGRVYVVSDINTEEYSDTGKTLGLFLVGQKRVWDPTGKEHAFAAYRFRKLSEIQAENAESAKHDLLLTLPESQNNEEAK